MTVKPKPSLKVLADVHNKKPLGFVYNGVVYRIDGECVRCGDCCLGQCRLVDLDSEGLATCPIHRVKPWDCFLYPATRSPENKLLSRCGYMVSEIRDRAVARKFVMACLGIE